MKVYVEVIWILNFLLDFMILYGTKRILKDPASVFRILLSSCYGSLTTLFLFWQVSSFSLFFIKILFSVFMILIAFGVKNFLSNLFYFYVISILIGGAIYLVGFYHNYTLQIFFLLCLAIVITFLFVWKYYSYHQFIHEKVSVVLYWDQHMYHLNGFIDTGNQLYSPFGGKPVALIDLKIPLKNVIYVPYKTLNEDGVIPCIKPDKMFVNCKEVTCLVGFAKQKISLHGCNCILPNCFKEEIL